MGDELHDAGHWAAIVEACDWMVFHNHYGHEQHGDHAVNGPSQGEYAPVERKSGELDGEVVNVREDDAGEEVDRKTNPCSAFGFSGNQRPDGPDHVDFPAVQPSGQHQKKRHGKRTDNTGNKRCNNHVIWANRGQPDLQFLYTNRAVGSISGSARWRKARGERKARGDRRVFDWFSHEKVQVDKGSDKGRSFNKGSVIHIDTCAESAFASDLQAPACRSAAISLRVKVVDRRSFRAI